MENEKAAAPDFTDCPYWGVGGRYVVDPATGRRVPVPPGDEAHVAVPGAIGQRPDDSEPGAQIDSQGLAPVVDSAAAAAEADTIKPLKEKRRG